MSPRSNYECNTHLCSALSGDALAALQDFYTQRDKDLDAFAQLRSTASNPEKSQTLTISSFSEDWNASQFWVKALNIGNFLF